MNSRWNEKLIIFPMTLVSTRSGNCIKIRVFGPTLELTSGQTWLKWLKISEKLGFDEKLLKVFILCGF